MKKDGCIFCSIVEGVAPSYKVWENEKHLSILSIFPNTEGFTVVLTKDHQDSYILALPKEIREGLIEAAVQTARILDEKLPRVGRTALIAEGFGVDHAHVKLFPMHETSSEEWKQHVSHVEKYFERYEGYVSSHNGPRADDATLAALQKKLQS